MPSLQGSPSGIGRFWRRRGEWLARAGNRFFSAEVRCAGHFTDQETTMGADLELCTIQATRFDPCSRWQRLGMITRK
jgi:hypothetical protein